MGSALTETDLMPIRSSDQLDYQVRYLNRSIELKVSRNGVLSNTYTISNEAAEFQSWCFDNDHVPEEPDNYYKIQKCLENADLLLMYAIEQLRSDFPL